MEKIQNMWRVALVINGIFVALYGVAVVAAMKAGFAGTQGISLLLTVLIIALLASSITIYIKRNSMTALNRFFLIVVLSPAIISGLLLLYFFWAIFS